MYLQTVRSKAEETLHGTIPLDGWVNFHGYFYHGCWSCHPFDHQLNTITIQTWLGTRENTQRNDAKIGKHPSVKRYIVMRECEWKRKKSSNPGI